MVSRLGEAAKTNGRKATKAPKKEPKKVLTIPALDLKMMTIKLQSDGSMVMNQFGNKSKEQMRRKQQGKAQGAREKKDPKQCFEDSLYKVPGKKNRYYMPAPAFKKAAVSACTSVHGIKKTEARQAFQVVGEIVELYDIDGPHMREDIVRVGTMSKTADLRYRGEFRKWKANVTIRYNTNVLSEEQIVNLFNVAGFAVGVGEGRPEKGDLGWGLFHVVGK